MSAKRLSLAPLLWMMTFSVILLFGGSIIGADGDLPTHIVYGQIVLEQGLPAADPTVYTGAGSPVLHEWGSELILAALYQLGGYKLVILAMACFVSTVPTLVYFASSRYGLWQGAVAFVSMILTAVPGPRPHLVTWALTTVVLLNLRQIPVWGYFLLSAMWVNLHAGVVVLGLVAVLRVFEAVVSAPDDREDSVWSLLAVVLGMQVNPWGPALWLHIFDFLGAPNPAADFQPPDLASNGLMWVYLPMAALCAVLAVKALIDRRLVEAGFLLWALFSGIEAVRNLQFLSIGIAVFAPAAMRWPTTKQNEDAGDLFRFASISVLIALAVLAPIEIEPRGPGAPIEATAYIQDSGLARQRGYVGYDHGGHVLLHSDVSEVWMHSLNANVPSWPDFVEQHQRVATASPGWERDLDTYEIQWALVSRGTRLEEALSHSLEWKEQWTSVGHAIYLRRDATPPVATLDLEEGGEAPLLENPMPSGAGVRTDVSGLGVSLPQRESPGAPSGSVEGVPRLAVVDAEDHAAMERTVRIGPWHLEVKRHPTRSVGSR